MPGIYRIHRGYRQTDPIPSGYFLNHHKRRYTTLDGYLNYNYRAAEIKLIGMDLLIAAMWIINVFLYVHMRYDILRDTDYDSA